MHSDGRTLTKCANSQCVINILVPRELWAHLQTPRTETTPDQRCGPHVSFVDPFVEHAHFPIASLVLRQGLARFPPFRVHLDEFGSFEFAKSATAFAIPRTDPPGALEDLSLELLRLFPQCHDTRKRTGRLVPHISLAKFRTAAQCREWMASAPSLIPPSSFVVSELHLLHRRGGDPFQVAEAVPLGSLLPIPVATPSFGRGSLGAGHPLLRSAFIGGLPKRVAEEHCPELLRALGLGASDQHQLLRNPDGKTRGILVASFPRPDLLLTALSSFRLPSADAVPAHLAAYLSPGLYALPMEQMAYPDQIGGTCYPTQAAVAASSSQASGPPAIAGGGAKGKAKKPRLSFACPQITEPITWAHTSALCVEIDAALHDAIQPVRQQFDHAFPRWMPHINLLYPFILDDLRLEEHLLPPLAEAISQMPCFSIGFKRLGFFKHSKATKTVHLVPEVTPRDALDALFQTLLHMFPNYVRETKGRPHLVPHMTIGQWPLSVPLSDIEPLIFTGRPFSFHVSHISFISRSDSGPFVVRVRLPLKN